MMSRCMIVKPVELVDRIQMRTWAARYNTWLLIKLTPKGVVFSFSFLEMRKTDCFGKTGLVLHVPSSS